MGPPPTTQIVRLPGWRLTQIIAKGEIHFPLESNNINDIPKDPVEHEYVGSCYLRINGQSEKREENVRSFFFFVPGRAIQLVFLQKGVRAVINNVLKSEFRSNVCQIKGEVLLNNFHYQGTFNFHWFTLFSHIIPAIEQRYPKIEVKVYQEEGVPTVRVNYREITKDAVITQVFVKVWQKGQKKEIITLKTQKAKEEEGAENTQSKTHISLVTPCANSALRQIQKLISSHSKWYQNN